MPYTFEQTSEVTRKNATTQDRQLDNSIRDISSLWNVLESVINGLIYDLYVAASDEVTPLEIANDVLTFEVQRGFELSSLRIGLNIAGTTSGITEIDVKKNGVSILSTTATIDLGELTTRTAATPLVISTTSFSDGDIISVDVLDISSGATEAGLKVYMLGNLTL